MRSSLFRGIYRISSSRLVAADYCASGFYFVTWKVKYNAPFLGCVKNGFVHLSAFGKIVAGEIYETMIIRPYVFIDTVVVMPDHVHVLFEFSDVHFNVETAQRAVSTDTTMGTTSFLYSDSLGAIVGQIKSLSTKRIRNLFSGFSWQSRFYDRVVRVHELERIRSYIRHNPKKHSYAT